MDSPPPSQLPRVRRKEFGEHPPVLGMDPRRLFLAFLLQASVLSIVVYQMYAGGALAVARDYAWVMSPWTQPCGLLEHKEFILVSDNVVRTFGSGPGYVHVRGSRIVTVATAGPDVDRVAFARHYAAANPRAALLDYGGAVIGPGLIDVHVHLNEPGREEWEGIPTGTAAAAAGGLTTLLDMPLNSEPCTNTVADLRAKRAAIRAGARVDVGAWGGVVPGNARDARALRALARAGARGFKSFLSPSGMAAFPNVSLADVAAAIPVLKRLGAPYLLHAELVDGDVPPGAEPRSYAEFLARRPARYERAAVHAVLDILRKDTTPARPGFVVHFVHLVSSSLLPALAAAKAEGLPVSVETCPHYLLFSADDVADGDTRFSCMPPIRSAANREALWRGLADGTIDLLASDHSPAPPALKHLDSGNFRGAWGGIAGLQYGLPASWHGAAQHGVGLPAFFRAWAAAPARLAALSARKGALRPGFDADLVVFDPSAPADTGAGGRQHRHKVTPYHDLQLRGRVLATFVRGQQVFDSEKGVAQQACGRYV
ncbi:DAL1 [Auxenochlorella protothecoides x Auxenochlorella symbiontica]|uniref:allantoinase n=2 Tax=Auxenochlorella protothecoides TaxID=3075 RepID=A0A3M7KPM5_AUXPR|nr:hypothetical protein APUTEX25_005080 [Auxenochlorella protothecoides]|eukprot:RMZ52327.1 hypothetical protein APUTEX25_005080 [Auxenochlorella protothecoides]